ncbi:MAG: hypothetical protein E6J11_20690 [Chloroflexi bacterium]|nr:MAG: hypothetical protein E6J11_20690 [Chloroflexota bacterium]
MSIDEVVEMLDGESEVAESYVLLRELKVLLDVDQDHFHPAIRVKIYRSNVIAGQPYHFEVSHHVHTPSQGAPYYPSRTCSESERGAIRQAISTTVSFLKVAIGEGHAPSESWLVPNEDF